MICVLEVIEGPARGRRVWVAPNQCVEIGRLSTSDFPITADNHMSRRHLVLDSTNNRFRVRDVGSANGTYINENRVTVQDVRHGDRLRAGSTTFLISLLEDDVNPHSIDGVQFGTSTSGTVRSVAWSPGATVSPAAENAPSLAVPPVANVANVANIAPPVESYSGGDSVAGGAPKKGTGTAHESDFHDGESTVLVTGPWWERVFSETDIPCLWTQRSVQPTSESDYLNMIKRITRECGVYLVLNLSQLDGESARQAEQLRGTPGVESLSKSLLLVSESGTPSMFWHFAAKGFRQDAVICVGSNQPLTKSEASEFANSLSFPSMLGHHMLNASGLRTLLLRVFRVVLFERNKEGVIWMLRTEANPSL